MKKRIEDLTYRDVIHCSTKEQWEKILKLNPKNNCKVDWWDTFKENTCYKYTGDDGRGNFSSLGFYKSEGDTIHKAKDFLEVSKSKVAGLIENTKECLSILEEMREAEEEIDVIDEWITKHRDTFPSLLQTRRKEKEERKEILKALEAKYIQLKTKN